MTQGWYVSSACRPCRPKSHRRGMPDNRLSPKMKDSWAALISFCQGLADDFLIILQQHGPESEGWGRSPRQMGSFPT